MTKTKRDSLRVLKAQRMKEIVGWSSLTGEVQAERDKEGTRRERKVWFFFFFFHVGYSSPLVAAISPRLSTSLQSKHHLHQHRSPQPPASCRLIGLALHAPMILGKVSRSAPQASTEPCLQVSEKQLGSSLRLISPCRFPGVFLRCR